MISQDKVHGDRWREGNEGQNTTRGHAGVSTAHNIIANDCSRSADFISDRLQSFEVVLYAPLQWAPRSLIYSWIHWQKGSYRMSQTITEKNTVYVSRRRNADGEDENWPTQYAEFSHTMGWRNEYDMARSPKKCYVLAPRADTRNKWLLAGACIAESKTAEYLGVIIENRGITDENTVLRIGNAISRQRFNEVLGNVLWTIQYWAILKLCKTFIRPVWEYAIHLSPMSVKSGVNCTKLDKSLWRPFRKVGPTADAETQPSMSPGAG